MSAPGDDQLNEMLKEGWAVSGYSVCMAAAGALVHNILLQKEEKLHSISIITNGKKEVGRSSRAFAPMPIPEKSIGEKSFKEIIHEGLEKRRNKQ